VRHINADPVTGAPGFGGGAHDDNDLSLFINFRPPSKKKVASQKGKKKAKKKTLLTPGQTHTKSCGTEPHNAVTHAKEAKDTTLPPKRQADQADNPVGFQKRFFLLGYAGNLPSFGVKTPGIRRLKGGGGATYKSVSSWEAEI